MEFVNSKVGKMSRITRIQEQKYEFEKTPTLKIKRYLYTEVMKSKGKREKVGL